MTEAPETISSELISEETQRAAQWQQGVQAAESFKEAYIEANHPVAGPGPQEADLSARRANTPTPEELRAEKEAPTSVEDTRKPEKLKKGVNVFKPDLESYAKRISAGEGRLDKTLADRDELQAELEELDDPRDVFITRGALEILDERVERFGRAWASNTKSFENAQRLTKLIANLGAPAAEALLAGFALPDVPAAVYGGSAPKLSGPRIEVRVQTLPHDVTDRVGQLRIDFVVPKYLHRPIASDVQDALAAGGCITDSGDSWRVTGQEDVEDGLVAIHYTHNRAIQGPRSI
jgi:hypothetical protein